ncbi:MAG TPA: putative oxidoreductase C-terminal domain-containing protein, partial [Bryobacteraceae bacterium]|nr:putative oxidoreductase C-terminal domain-containing protein [Bryobacteraceae bacterium]
HVVDLVQWTAFPDQLIDYRTDIEMMEGRRWPLSITPSQFQMVTGQASFPNSLNSYISSGNLNYFCNNSFHYTLRNVHIKMEIVWDWQAPDGTGDVYEATFRGTKARIEVRQGKAENYRPELYIVPNSTTISNSVFAALRDTVQNLQSRWPGLSVFQSPHEMRIVIPDHFREGHEAHFAQVTGRFFEYLRDPSLMPRSETPNMLAKYYVTTRGVELGRQQSQSN